MKEKMIRIALEGQGVDAAAAAIEEWLTEAKVKRRDVLRIRLTMEELLGKLCADGGGSGEGAQVLAILQMLFGILPTNPFRPFLEGNTLQIPMDGLVVGVTLAMLLDFPCTAARIFILHLETALQADKLGLLDPEVLRCRQ